LEENGNFYLEAYSHDVNEFRTFNLQNVNRARILEEDCVEIDEVKAAKSEKVQFRLDSDSIFHLENSAKITKTGSAFEIDVFQREWIVRNVLRDGGAMTITAPVELRSDVRNLANSALENYQK
jgi:predicted DNA-binding transcriptional regulator YafY